MTLNLAPYTNNKIIQNKIADLILMKIEMDDRYKEQLINPSRTTMTHKNDLIAINTHARKLLRPQI